jgi:hypothetical protein
MIKQEAEDVIERIRDDLKRHGVLIGYDTDIPIADFGCDLDHHIAQNAQSLENRVVRIVIHDEGLWEQLKQGAVNRCIVSECQGKLFGMPVMVEPRSDASYTIQYKT